MNFEGQNLFEESLRSGINLFLGAGFSILAKDQQGNFLPLGSTLCDELKIQFKIAGDFNLIQVASILEKTKRAEFYSFLNRRFSVAEIPSEYYCINSLNIKGIYTTNIDNLVHKIFEKSKTKYLNDVAIGGSTNNDNTAVDYSALHGSILYPDRPLIFDIISLSNTYSSSPRVWNYLSAAVEKLPTLFWGYSLSDSSVIQSLTSRNAIEKAQKEKWIIIRKEDLSNSEYFSALGFKIIVSSTKEFLEYLNATSWLKGAEFDSKKHSGNEYKDIEFYFSKNLVPKSPVGLVVRPIKDFFLGNPPIWTDIFSKQIFQTSHFSKIKDKIFAKKNSIIVIGAPVSGKTTILMHLAVNTNFEGIKLVFSNIELSKAQLLIKFLQDRPCLIFIDNFCDSVEAFNFLTKFKNIRVVGFDRSHNFGIISHLLDDEELEILNITKLSDLDIQGIYDSLPATLKKEVLKRETNTDYEKDSIFEFISRNVKSPTIKERYSNVLKDLMKKDIFLAEFLVLSSYVHYTRIPLSFEMALSYFSQRIESYDVILEMKNDLGDLLRDYSGELVIDNDQDYYYPRSVYTAETILDLTEPNLLKDVINNVLYNIPSAQICHYNIFKKKAYDKNIINKAFLDWQEGKEFYEEAFQSDFHNPYVLQQGALYLAQKKRYTEAFQWIDKAITMTNNKYFSIRNSHAIILFDANINSKENSEIRHQLDLSMSILEKCIYDDKRKSFHAIRYGEQSVQYNDRYFDSKSFEYLRNASTWLKEEHRRMSWNNEISSLLKKVDERLKLDSSNN
jgi:hypothetical protein